MAAELTHAMASLRHLYANMINGAVRDTASAKRIAEGILSCAIQELEVLATQQATQGAEPVGVVREIWEPATGKTSIIATLDKPVPAGTKLYTAPPPTAEVTDEQLRNLYAELDAFARVVDHYEYGLPWLGFEDREPTVLALMRAALQSDQAQAGKGDGSSLAKEAP